MPVYTSSIEVTADYPTIKPSLNLNFARSRSLDPRITFTRASVGTYVGRDGLIKTAGVDKARFDHDPETLESLGLLIEQSRTNSLPYSSSIIGNVNWSGAGVAAIAATSITAPDGSTDTVALRDDGSNGQHTLFDDVSVSDIAAVYTASCWVKAGTRNYAELFSNGGGTAGTITIGYKYDLVNKTTLYTGTTGFDTGTSATITEYPNGWFRITMTGDVADTATGAGTYRWHVRARTDVSGNYQGDNTDGIYIWGPQLELGSFQTSYIPTNGAAVTRAADSAIAAVTGKGFYNFNEGTYLVEGIINATLPANTYGGIFGIGSGGGNSNFLNYNPTNNHGYYASNTSQSPASSLTKSYTPGTKYKLAGSYDSTGFSASADGDISSNTATGILNNTNNGLYIGSNAITGNTFGVQTIAKASYYPQRLTNAQLQLLTS